jgi:hypothetical protein
MDGRRPQLLLGEFGGDGVDEEGAFADEAEVSFGFLDEVRDGGEVGLREEVFQGEALGRAEF